MQFFDFTVGKKALWMRNYYYMPLDIYINLNLFSFIILLNIEYEIKIQD